jgi:hypothetical protein
VCEGTTTCLLDLGGSYRTREFNTDENDDVDTLREAHSVDYSIRHLITPFISSEFYG